MSFILLIKAQTNQELEKYLYSGQRVIKDYNQVLGHDVIILQQNKMLF